MSDDSHGHRNSLTVGEPSPSTNQPDAIDQTTLLAFSLKVLLDNLLRRLNAQLVTTHQTEAGGGVPRGLSCGA